MSGGVLNLVLSHQPAAAVMKMLGYWRDFAQTQNLLLAYGGTRAEFDLIEHTQKVFIDDEGLRTRDHQRELQSYTRLFQAGVDFVQQHTPKFEFVHFAEFDHLPLVRDLNQRQIERLGAENADVMGFHLYRIDGTNNPHFLYHVAHQGFAAYWMKMSCRSEPEVVLSMFGSGSFWKWEAFRAVAARNEPFPIYLEIYLPTMAHHLGFRIRDFAEQNQFIRVLRDETDFIEEARARGAWTLHPVKRLWTA